MIMNINQRILTMINDYIKSKKDYYTERQNTLPIHYRGVEIDSLTLEDCKLHIYVLDGEISIEVYLFKMIREKFAKSKNYYYCMYKNIQDFEDIPSRFECCDDCGISNPNHQINNKIYCDDCKETTDDEEEQD